MSFDINSINEYYKTRKLTNENIINEKEKFLNFSKLILEKIIKNDIKNIDLDELKELEKYTQQLHPLLLDEIIPYELLKDKNEIKIEFKQKISAETVIEFYKYYWMLYNISKIWKNLWLNIKTNQKELFSQIKEFNLHLENLDIKNFFYRIKKEKTNKLIDYKNTLNLDIMPFETIFSDINKFKEFLTFVWNYTTDNSDKFDDFISEIIQINTNNLFYNYMKDKNKSYKIKFSNFLTFYEKYISKNIYITKTRKDFIQIFWELFINFKWIDEIKEKYLLKKEPDRLLRYAYIKYYPNLKEIFEDITNKNIEDRLKLWFVSTLAFFERIYEKWLQNKYFPVIKDLYFKIVNPKLNFYSQKKQSKIEYLNYFLNKYPNFLQEIENESTETKLINTLKNIQDISEYIQLHKEWKVDKKLNKKDLKKLINDTIHYNEIVYLLDNNLINIKKLSDFIDLCIPNLTTTGLFFLWKNNKFKSFISKQKLIKLIKIKKDIKFLILIESLNYKLTEKEQKDIVNLLKNTNHFSKLCILNWSSLIDSKFTKEIDEKIKNIIFLK